MKLIKIGLLIVLMLGLAQPMIAGSRTIEGAIGGAALGGLFAGREGAKWGAVTGAAIGLGRDIEEGQRERYYRNYGEPIYGGYYSEEEEEDEDDYPEIED